MPLRRLALALLVLPAGAFAHHGWSSYDEARPITFTGRLSNVRWSNPHGTARVTRADQPWAVVLAPTARMDARGLTREMLAKPVTLVGYARSDGTREMRIERVTVAGKTIELR